MLDFAEINIKDKKLFDRYFSMEKGSMGSEMNFTNLFIWRHSYKFRYVVIGNALCIISVPEEKHPFAFFPAGCESEDELRKAIEFLKEYFSSKGWHLVFERVMESGVKRLKSLEGMDFEVIYDRNNSDYVYLANELKELKGKKYDGKRNHVNKFRKKFEFEYISINSGLTVECKRVLDDWCREKGCEQHGVMYCEKLANNELLDNLYHLGCHGAAIKVNGSIEAFTVGDVINDTAIIHVEKANGKIDGLYTFINQQFCERLRSEVVYINREQDLGIEGLRKAKLSYHPIKLLDKYSVHVKY